MNDSCYGSYRQGAYHGRVSDQIPHPSGLAWLLSRVGHRVSQRFGERVAELGLTPSDAATLRTLGLGGPASQRELAERLGLAPSRLVVLVDSLESKGLVVRTPSEADRRRHDVSLTETGHEAFARLRTLALAHEREITTGLSGAEITALTELLKRIQAPTASATKSPDS